MQEPQGPSFESQAGLIFFFNQEELVRVLYKALSFLGLHLDELGYCVAQSLAQCDLSNRIYLYLINTWGQNNPFLLRKPAVRLF